MLIRLCVRGYSIKVSQTPVVRQTQSVLLTLRWRCTQDCAPWDARREGGVVTL